MPSSLCRTQLPRQASLKTSPSFVVSQPRSVQSTHKGSQPLYELRLVREEHKMIRAPPPNDPRATGRGIDSLDPDLGHTDICAINRCYDHAFLWIRRMILPYLILWQTGKPYKRKHWHANL